MVTSSTLGLALAFDPAERGLMQDVLRALARATMPIQSPLPAS